jgi:hypothetical protein
MNKEIREMPAKGVNVGNMKRCYVCNSTNHLASYHSRANATATNQLYNNSIRDQ